MAARSNLVLTDRAATPVAHTFTPDGDDVNGVALWSEKGSVPAGNPRFSGRIYQDKGGKYRASLKLTVPIVQTQTINGVASPVVVRTGYVELNATFDSLSSDQERKDAIGMMASALPAAQAQINDMLISLTPVW